jgi:hypothetical protein
MISAAKIPAIAVYQGTSLDVPNNRGFPGVLTPEIGSTARHETSNINNSSRIGSLGVRRLAAAFARTHNQKCQKKTLAV